MAYIWFGTGILCRGKPNHLGKVCITNLLPTRAVTRSASVSESICFVSTCTEKTWQQFAWNGRVVHVIMSKILEKIGTSYPLNHTNLEQKQNGPILFQILYKYQITSWSVQLIRFPCLAPNLKSSCWSLFSWNQLCWEKVIYMCVLPSLKHFCGFYLNLNDSLVYICWIGWCRWAKGIQKRQQHCRGLTANDSDEISSKI